jgi:hypothetical protein
LPVLSATSCSIHSPSEARLGASATVSLSRPAAERGADERPEHQPGVFAVLLAASFGHRFAGGVDVAHGCADQRRRDEPEERQRREPAADVRRVQEDLAVSAFARQRVQRRPRIRHGDELPAGAFAEGVPHALPEVALHRRHFHRAAALARHEDPRAGGIHACRGRRNRLLVGGVEHDQLRMAGATP